MRVWAITALLVLCGVAFASAESELAGVETIEPVFVEEAADAAGESEGFPHVLSKKMQKTTVEPRYYGENPNKLKQFVTPEYAMPKVVDPRKARKHPRVFTSHYFSPLPKTLKGKKLRVSRNKKGRKYIPFRATVKTPIGERMAKKGFTEAELRYGRLPNKFDDPKDRMKNTMAPAPTPSLVELSAEEAVEVDTTEEMEAAEGEQSNPPPFSTTEVEGSLPTMINGPEEFYQSGWSAPTWSDEAASSEEQTSEVDAEADAEATADTASEDVAESAAYEDMEAEVALIEAVAAENSEDEEADEAEDESEEEEESEETDESEEEADEESDEEADEESEEESDEESDEELTEVALIEEADEAEDEIEDEMAVNESIVSQVDMDATSDEAGLVTEQDSAEASEAADEADMEANEEAAEAVDADLQSADNLLVEVDAHLAEEGEEEADEESDSEAESESDAEDKGTPGSAISAGMTWEDAQNARLDAIESQLAAEKAAAPKVAAKVVSSTADLAKTAANEQEPEYETENAAVETTAPELVEAAPSAQQVLLEKIAKLKAIRRN
jgi:hypothetical protein